MKIGNVPLTSVFAVLLLIFGVFAGVLLVQQEQEFRERAGEIKEHKVAVCHKTSSDSNEWVQIEVSENSVELHLAHGDIQGNCPSDEPSGEEPPSGGDGDGDSGDGGGDGSGGTGGTSDSPTVQLASTVTVNNETKSETIVERIVEKEYVYVTTRLDFWVKFQGVDERRDNKTVRLIFRRGEEELHVYNGVVVQADNEGIYSGTITDIRPGTYEVLIKGDGYLQRKIEEVALVRGRNQYFWSKTELLAGDFDFDNDIDADDISEFFSYYTIDLVPVTEETNVFDLNMNGFIDVDDINLVLGNYNDLTVMGDS